MNNTIADLNQKIDGEHNKLAELHHVGKGMETAANDVFLLENNKGLQPLENEEIDHKGISPLVRKRLVAENISRYSLAEQPEYLLYIEDIDSFEKLPKAIQEHLEKHKKVLSNRATVRNEGRTWWRYSRPMHRELYHLPKIWCSYRSKDHAFILDETGGEYIGLTNTTVIFETNSDISIKYVLALLNSKLLSFRYKSIGKQTGSGVFEYVPNGVGKLPIPNIDMSAQQPFIELVDRMLLLHVQLQEQRREFHETVSDRFDGIKITDKLEQFEQFPYKHFSAEVENQGFKIPVHRDGEWRNFFNKTKKQLSAIRERIERTDAEIDRLVYDLYGLIDEEIAMVKPSIRQNQRSRWRN